MRVSNNTTIRLWFHFLATDKQEAAIGNGQIPTVQVFKGATEMVSTTLTQESNSLYYYDFVIPDGADAMYCAYVKAIYATGENISQIVCFIAGQPKKVSAYTLFTDVNGEDVAVEDGSANYRVYNGSERLQDWTSATNITDNLYYGEFDHSVTNDEVFAVSGKATLDGTSTKTFHTYLVGGRYQQLSVGGTVKLQIN